MWILALTGWMALAAEAQPSPSAHEWVTVSSEHMRTRIDVTLPSDQAHHASEVFTVFDHVDQVANEWKSESPLSAVNARPGVDVPVPDDLRALVRRSLQIGELTDGAFDVTWGAMWGLWNFNRDIPAIPSQMEIERRLPLVGYQQVVVNDDQGTVRVGEGMIVGLGGIAKGQALDVAGARLRELGVTQFSISAGGQVLVAGDRVGPDGERRPWRVGIRDPRGEPDDYFAIVEARDQSVSTSGDYERFFIIDGVRYHHIMDPRTGWPARGLRSATVIGGDATLMDALSTAVMVLGVEKGLALVERLPEVDAVVVDLYGQVFSTEGARIQQVHQPAERANSEVKEPR